MQLFTSLYSMLPTSKKYLAHTGFSRQAASYMLVGLFLAGVVVIRVVSALIHRYIPSHVVDCAHSHRHDPDPESGEGYVHGGTHHNETTERTPLLTRQSPTPHEQSPTDAQQAQSVQLAVNYPQQKESLRQRLSRHIGQLVGSVKANCDDSGPCYGFSQACGHECSKVLPRSSPQLDGPVRSPLLGHHESNGAGSDSEQASQDRHRERLWLGASLAEYQQEQQGPEQSQLLPPPGQLDTDDAHSDNTVPSFLERASSHRESGPSLQSVPRHHSHHHHVPQNAFLSVGLQTVLAIALHKLPEGFITYATNHVSPKLGMAVFLALFIHNISEGFAMSLPLYLALNSRWKAMLWSSLLGGVSQPAGAGIAALWIWGSHRGGGDGPPAGPSWGVYGGMFAATAGIMTSVGLQLYGEGSELTHNRGICVGFAIAGMGLMGLSFALTA